jgi:hypothetical protein
MFGGAGGNGNVGCNTGFTGGGAGNPGGVDTPDVDNERAGAESGTGGLLVVFVRGKLTIGAGGRISANGSLGGRSIYSGGSSGGGRIIVLHGGLFESQGTIEAKGGPSNTSGQGYASGSGGDGAVTVDSIAP